VGQVAKIGIIGQILRMIHPLDLIKF